MRNSLTSSSECAFPWSTKQNTRTRSSESLIEAPCRSKTPFVCFGATHENSAASAARSRRRAVIQGQHIRSSHLDVQVLRGSAIVRLSQWALFSHLQRMLHSNVVARPEFAKFGQVSPAAPPELLPHPKTLGAWLLSPKAAALLARTHTHLPLPFAVSLYVPPAGFESSGNQTRCASMLWSIVWEP